MRTTSRILSYSLYYKSPASRSQIARMATQASAGNVTRGLAALDVSGLTTKRSTSLKDPLKSPAAFGTEFTGTLHSSACSLVFLTCYRPHGLRSLDTRCWLGKAPDSSTGESPATPRLLRIALCLPGLRRDEGVQRPEWRNPAVPPGLEHEAPQPLRGAPTHAHV